MTIAKCACGAEACIHEDSPGFDGFWVFCEACGWSGPYKPTESEAIAAWNPVMRPRPVVQWQERDGLCGRMLYAFTGNMVAGIVEHDVAGKPLVTCNATESDHHFRGSWDDCLVWLHTKLIAAGFDVESEEA